MSADGCYFEYDVCVSPPVLTVRLSGEFDFAAAERLVWPDWADLEEVRILFVDLRKLAFCDAAGLAALKRLCKGARERGCDVQLSGVTPAMRKVADLTGLGADWPALDAT